MSEQRAYFKSLVLSPITSYTDQILSIHRTRTSAGFSLDIPFIMLTASILKVFYWPGARYDIALFVQAMIMIVVQMILLKVSLDNRPSWRDEGPFAPKADGRPFNFWRWRLQRPYVHFLLSLRRETGRLKLTQLKLLGISPCTHSHSPCLPHIQSTSHSFVLHENHRLPWSCHRSHSASSPNICQLPCSIL